MTNDQTNAHVYIEPQPGYQYLGNTCGIIVNDLNIRNKESGKTDMLIVQDITRDIECTINFGEKSDRIILHRYKEEPEVPSELYIIKNKSWYEDSTSVKAITKLSKNPTMDGYEYKGYYTQTNKEWLEPKSIYEALSAKYQNRDFKTWNDFDKNLYNTEIIQINKRIEKCHRICSNDGCGR